MNRLLLLAIAFILYNCNDTSAQDTKITTYTVSKTDTEWKQQLTKSQYHVLRKAGTEKPFSSKLNNEKRPGVFVCSACETPLFKSENKYDSGSGWPSFDKEIKGNLKFKVDYNLGHARTEEHCATCGGHLGHIFNDGPKETTGKRHCINGVALKFIPQKNE